MRLSSLLLVAAWSAAAKRTPKVIYVNLDNDEVLAIQRLVEEETGSRWAAVAGAWGRYRLALFEQGDLDRLERFLNLLVIVTACHIWRFP